jgi:STE24 endopeptidase
VRAELSPLGDGLVRKLRRVPALSKGDRPLKFAPYNVLKAAQAGPTHRKMKHLVMLLIALAFAILSSFLCAGAVETPASTSPAQLNSPPSPTVPATAVTPVPTAPRISAYTLSPDRYRKARNLSRIQFRFAIVSFLYGLAVLWMILRWNLAPKYRNWAERAFSRRPFQALVFAPLILLTIGVFELPVSVYENWLSRQYGLSVQGWGSWSWDWVKAQVVGVVIGTIAIVILYAVIRISPRRWWLYFWLASLPLAVCLFFLEPLVVDPLFHEFKPLADKAPALTVSLEKMLQRAGENIPPQRMFWMGAAKKSTALNAYVTGIGTSKRIVVYDTTIAKMNTPQIVFVAGHETGHYVLYHIPKLIAWNAAILLAVFYIGYRFVGWTLARWGQQWGIRGIDDWASLPVLMLLLAIFTFALNPLTNAISRHYEHQADQYGLEVTHGLTTDSGQVAAQSFNVLGDVDLADPEPNWLHVFLFYNHPPIPDRIRFSLTYDPWSKGGRGEFLP